MAKLQRALEDDPELGLLSVIPKNPAVKLNLNTIGELQTMVNEDLEVDLLSRFPKNYTIVRERRGHRWQKKILSKKIEKTQPDDVLKHFNQAVSATVELPLSNAVTTLLATHMKSITDSMNPSESLAHSLKLLLQQSEKLWESQGRGAVFKCSDDIVAKVVTRVVNSGEYTTMKDMREDKKDRKFREDLYNTSPRDDKFRIEQTKGNLVKDSYRWTLQTQDFQKWRQDPDILVKGGRPRSRCTSSVSASAR
ncbi:hypothetical protein VE04_02711 [Pseudogymnoascus sp. 24MN13]|nr:hypothetical protein VE04_02711 [Pseudogymnoascus sp. 24MN13]